ncbi:hypothetical protein EV06_0851 [Prochlorococcus sp. MIT 0602]|nr:hypothetical protein EV06_0851 [Prochlorococcus sp. MIT 0602]
MQNLPPGTYSLAVLGALFFLLQAYWISITLRDLKSQGVFADKRDQIAETRKKLEKLLNK